MVIVVGILALVPAFVVVVVGVILLFFGVNLGMKDGIFSFNFNPILFVIGVVIIVVGLPVAVTVAKKLDC